MKTCKPRKIRNTIVRSEMIDYDNAILQVWTEFYEDQSDKSNESAAFFDMIGIFINDHKGCYMRAVFEI